MTSRRSAPQDRRTQPKSIFWKGTLPKNFSWPWQGWGVLKSRFWRSPSPPALKKMFLKKIPRKNFFWTVFENFFSCPDRVGGGRKCVFYGSWTFTCWKKISKKISDKKNFLPLSKKISLVQTRLGGGRKDGAPGATLGATRWFGAIRGRQGPILWTPGGLVETCSTLFKLVQTCFRTV